MALLSIADAKGVAKSIYGYRMATKSAAKDLLEHEVASASAKQSFDVFLSHSYQDASVDNEALLGVYKIIERAGFVVYVDWIVDKELSRETVTSQTAGVLRYRMKQSKSLLFVTSTNSATSKWMPWELGYFDGFRGRVGIVPLTGGTAHDFKGQEYLGLYPMFDLTGTIPWMHSAIDPSKFVRFSDWLVGKDP